MERLRDRWLPVVIIAVCLALALGGQAVGDSVSAPSGDSTTEIVGRTSLSYLTGIRRYTAAILWNRIDPLLHGYYDDVPLDQQKYMLSTISAVEWLDPDFDQPYYVGSWILVRNGKVDEGMEMIRRGAERIPDSGALHMAHAQMLDIITGNLPAALAEARVALQPEMRWTDDVERINGYAAIAQLFRKAGEYQLAEQVAAEIDRLDAQIDNAAPEAVHDHDGDGVPDH